LLPKKGFTNKRHRQKQGADMVVLNLGTIQDYIDMGRLKIEDDDKKDEDIDDNSNNPLKTLGMVDFIEAGIFKKKASLPGVKLLAKGKERFKAPVRLVVNRASEEAIAVTEEVGGQVTTVHFNRLAMRALIRPDKFPKLASDKDGDDDDKEEDQYLLPKSARPPPKLQPYYTSWKNRGYLCPQVQMREWLQARPDMQDAFQKALEARSGEQGQ
jgi:ribosomal protein L15